MKSISEEHFEPISWAEVMLLDDNYREVLEKEYYHPLFKDKAGIIRWVPYPDREQQIMNQFGAKDLNDLFGRIGADKNDERVRELYKYMGYSLFGYWEIFYWEVNNEKADQYLGRLAQAEECLMYDVIEKQKVAILGNEIGFGRLMQLAQRIWRDQLAKDGLAGTEFQIGPCAGLTEPCGCEIPSECDWCCGTQWLTRHVKTLKNLQERDQEINDNN